MSRLKITPEEVEIIRRLRKRAQESGLSIGEWLNQLIEWAYEANLDKTRSNWFVDESGNIEVKDG